LIISANSIEVGLPSACQQTPSTDQNRYFGDVYGALRIQIGEDGE
jgi:hypothetical protein